MKVTNSNNKSNLDKPSTYDVYVIQENAEHPLYYHTGLLFVDKETGFAMRVDYAKGGYRTSPYATFETMDFSGKRSLSYLGEAKNVKMESALLDKQNPSMGGSYVLGVADCGTFISKMADQLGLPPVKVGKNLVELPNQVEYQDHGSYGQLVPRADVVQKPQQQVESTKSSLIEDAKTVARQQVVALAREKFGDVGAAAIAGNIDVETGGSFDYQQKQHGNGPGYGLFQMEAPMRKAYDAFLEKNKQTDSAESQLAFARNELKYGEHIGAGNAQKIRDAFNSGDVNKATATFSELFERPSVPHLDRRQQSAREQLAEMQKTTQADVQRDKKNNDVSANSSQDNDSKKKNDELLEKK